MTAFAAALDALFADRNLALDRVYPFWRHGPGGAGPRHPPPAGPHRRVRQTRIVSETVSIDIRTSDVDAPRPGDSIYVDGTIYPIQGEPVRDPEGLVWEINAAAVRLPAAVRGDLKSRYRLCMKQRDPSPRV